MHARQAPPRFGTHRLQVALKLVVELLGGYLALSRFGEQCGHRVTQVGKHLHVQRRIVQPRLGKRAGRPVRRRMLLREVDAEELLDHRPEADPRHPEKPRRELGVEDVRRVETDLAEAGQILRRGVEDPLVVRY